MTQSLDPMLQSGFSLGDFAVHPVAREINGPDGLCHVSPRAMDLLVLLASRAGEAVPLEVIGAGPGGAEAIDDTISELRWALDDDPDRPRFLEALPDGGYRLLAVPEIRPDAGAGILSAEAGGGGFGTLLKDLRRRHVFRVGAAYSIAAWLVIQVADVLFDALGAPALSMRLLVVTLGAGLPIAVALAWAYQLTPQGLRIDPVTGRRRGRPGLPPGVFAVAGVGAALVGGLAYWWTYRPALDFVQTPLAVVPDNGASLAVLPFADLDGAESGGYLGDGLSEELQQRLAALSGLS